VFFNPHLELAEHIGRHFESCRRTSPIFIMVVFVLSKWAEFNELTLHKNMYQEFLSRTQMFTCLSVNDPTKEEVVVPAPWLVHLWLVDADCNFFIEPRLRF
jgi:hypothetical protein